MIQQMSLSSCEYGKEVNEFIKAGFTEEKAKLVQPPMVKESKIKLEGKVRQIIPLGTEGGAGNLVLVEILLMHIDESVLTTDRQIDQKKLDLVARLGDNWYTRANVNTLFEVEKPNLKLGIGFDQLPASIKNSAILTGNHLGQLANVSEIPSIDPTYHDERLKEIIQYYSIQPVEMERELHLHAASLLSRQLVQEAWQVLLASI